MRYKEASTMAARTALQCGGAAGGALLDLPRALLQALTSVEYACMHVDNNKRASKRKQKWG